MLTIHTLYNYVSVVVDICIMDDLNNYVIFTLLLICRNRIIRF